MDIAPNLLTRPASVASRKFPLPSFKNSRAPPPIEFTKRSRSPSPSTSAKTAPVEYCPAHLTPARSVISSKRQPPRLRYRRLASITAPNNKTDHTAPTTRTPQNPEPDLWKLNLGLQAGLKKFV